MSNDGDPVAPPLQGVAIGGAEIVTGECIAVALATLLRERGGVWTGTAADLLALLPSGTAKDATRLSKRLRDAANDLVAFGVGVQRTREARTGRRLVTLRAALPIYAGRDPMDESQPHHVTTSAATRRAIADALQRQELNRRLARVKIPAVRIGRGE